MKQSSLFADPAPAATDREADILAVVAGERVHAPLWDLFETMRGDFRPQRTNPTDLATYRVWLNAAWADYFRDVREEAPDSPELRVSDLFGFCAWLRARQTLGWNWRYTAFARSQGRTAEAQRAHDRSGWVLAPTIPFQHWIGEMWDAFFAERREKAPTALWPHHHDAFDAWLERRFPVEVKA